MVQIMLWSFVLAVLIVPVLYIACFFPSASFWESAISGLVGTAAALIGGIPIALLIDRAIKRKEEKKELEAEKAKERNILILLKEELVECKKVLTERLGTNLFITLPIKSSFWNAATHGGKINYISSNTLLSNIASTYYFIEVIQDIESLTLKAINSATVSYNDGTTAQHKLYEQAHSFYGQLYEKLNCVLPAIDTHIAVLET